MAARAFLCDYWIGLPAFQVNSADKKGHCIASGKPEKDLGNTKCHLLRGLCYTAVLHEASILPHDNRWKIYHLSRQLI